MISSSFRSSTTPSVLRLLYLLHKFQLCGDGTTTESAEEENDDDTFDVTKHFIEDHVDNDYNLVILLHLEILYYNLRLLYV